MINSVEFGSDECSRHPASFRDPAGYVIEAGGQLFRAIHPKAQNSVAAFFQSGLHDELADAGLLIRHRRVEPEQAMALGLPAGWGLLAPELRLPVISYACEWTDAQLLEAGMLTLEILHRCAKAGYTLKDASSYNVQFNGSKPVFIDLLSIEPAPRFAKSWDGYRQFCEHFLAPLALRRYRPGRWSQAASLLLGVRLNEASTALPARTWLRPGLMLHLHLHARADLLRVPLRASQVAATSDSNADQGFLISLARSLASALQSVAPRQRSSSWSEYRHCNSYEAAAAAAKLAFVHKVAASIGATRALDLGANDGHYARAVAALGVACTAVELDHECSERLHLANKSSPHATLLNTLRVDLSNPTPAHGWAHVERASFVDRLSCELVLALALVHHLSITGQTPYTLIAEFFAALGRHVIVEFVPPNDPMSRSMLALRANVQPQFLQSLSEVEFTAAFARHFALRDRLVLPENQRVLYHFERHAHC